MEIYCLKCRKKVAAQHTQKAVLENGRHQVKGQCPHCQGKVSKLVSGKK